MYPKKALPWLCGCASTVWSTLGLRLVDESDDCDDDCDGSELMESFSDVLDWSSNCSM